MAQNVDEPEFTVIYLADLMLVSKRRFKNWRDIQDRYATYKASLNPDTLENLVEYLEVDYGPYSPTASWSDVLRELRDSKTIETIVAEWSPERKKVAPQ